MRTWGNLINKVKNRLLFFTIKYFQKAINRYLLALFKRFKFIPDFVSQPQFFNEWEKLGFHITSTHFYQAMPILSQINNKFWETPLYFNNVNFDYEKQKKLLSLFSKNFKTEFDKIPINKDSLGQEDIFFIENGNFTSVDSEILFCFIRELKPNNIIEIGSGFTTLLISKAITANVSENNKDVTYTTIDPFPRDFIIESLPINVVFIKQKVEEVDLSIFRSLKENDILFIDSSHVFKYDNDVYFEILKIIPILQKGVIIHFHDIFLPFHYPKQWVFEHKWLWNEQYFLLAFLMFNDSFEIIWSGSYMHHNDPEKLETVFASYSHLKSTPGSLWIQKIK